jgi:hypothetical protein
MKRFSVAIGLTLALAAPAAAQPSGSCAKIKDGTITAADGTTVLTPGYDKYGYNYQAKMFNGLYANYFRPTTPVTEGTENVVIKWSDEWLATVDCNHDGKLDRGLNPKTGESDGMSKGWVTNHFEGDYIGTDQESHHYTYFVKITYVGPAQPGVVDPFTLTRIWGVYAVIEEIQTDPYGEYGGRLHFVNKITGPGLGR